MKDLRLTYYNGSNHTALILNIEDELAKKDHWRSCWVEENLLEFRRNFTGSSLRVVENSKGDVMGYFTVETLEHFRKMGKIAVKPGANYEAVVSKILGFAIPEMSLNGSFALNILAKEYDDTLINFLRDKGFLSRSYVTIDRTEVSVCDSYILEHNIFSRFSSDHDAVITKLPRKYFFDIALKLNSSTLVEWEVLCLDDDRTPHNFKKDLDPAEIYFSTLSSISKTREVYNFIAGTLGIKEALDEVKIKPRSSLILPSSWIVGKEELLERDLSGQFVPVGKTYRYKDFENNSWWNRGPQ